MNPILRQPLGLSLVLCGLMIGAALVWRPLLPVDETRYVSVAWEMWLRGDFLVPHLNGAPYSHKPPLLFWLIQAGWGLFGVNDWWPRLVAPLFAAGNLVLTAHLARRLWPDEDVHLLAPLLLVGALYWGLFSTLTMFDMLLGFWTLTGIIGLVAAWREGRITGWALFALAIGGGVLSKGPVILVHLLPAALLGPYWTATPWAGAWRRGYAWLLVAVVAGAVLALAWAVPAGLRGGEAYGDAIFWGQSAGRLVKSFAHQEPFWWYAAILPAMVLPWAVWPAALRRLWRLVRPVESHATGGFDAGRRLLAIWAIATFVILSVISGKRPHYLLPIFPALALAGALLLSQIGDPAGERKPRRDLSGPVGLVMLVAAVLTLTPWLAPVLGHPEWADDIDILWTLPPIVGGAWLLWRPPGRLAARTLAIACIGALAVMSLQGFLAGKLDRIYDLRPTARHLAALQKDGRAIAHYGKYHGQFNFLGRLAKPLEETGDAEVVDWLRRHPGGKVLSYHRRLPAGAKPDFQQRFRGRIIAIWDGAAVLANPDIAKRGSE